MLQLKNNAEAKSIKNVIPPNKLINVDHDDSPDLIESSGRIF